LAVALWEFCCPRQRLEFPSRRRRCANIEFWIVNLALAALILGPPAGFRARLEGDFAIGLPSWPIANPVLSFGVAFALLDFLRYAVHRIEHAVPWLWRLHALHHSDPVLDATTSVRHHPFEYLLSSTVYWSALVILDVPASAIILHGLAVFAAAALQHGNIRLPRVVEACARPVLLTPDLHRVHHSIEWRETNSNYGAILAVWDRLFGTLAVPTSAAGAAIVFGVRELTGSSCSHPVEMLMTPWRLARAIGRARAAD
jgi:sterol desaturase/sphingolipid hydroxylase (fatty acid hydroxylase superfamily)